MNPLPSHGSQTYISSASGCKYIGLSISAQPFVNENDFEFAADSTVEDQTFAMMPGRIFSSLAESSVQILACKVGPSAPDTSGAHLCSSQRHLSRFNVHATKENSRVYMTIAQELPMRFRSAFYRTDKRSTTSLGRPC